MSLNFFSIPDKRLSASILATDMSFRVSNILGWDGDALEAADFGSLHYVAFRNSSNTQIEFMEIDPTTIASTSITINKRGLQLNATDLTTEVTANKYLWVKGDTIVSFGTNPPQLYQYLKEYIDGIAIAGSPDASTTAKGLVEEATQAELRARTAAGSTAARLAVNPSILPNVLIQDYVIDTGTADAYAIAPTPAIVAYVTGQRFTFKATNDNTGASTIAVNGLASPKTIKKADGATDLDAGDIQNGQIVEVEYDGTNFQLMSPVGHDLATTVELDTAVANAVRFGGTGADGALSISSGTTDIDCGAAQLVVKNYTSISITGTGKLTFSNPHANGTIIILKSQGNVTLTSSQAPMIDASGMGAVGGVAVSRSTIGSTIGNDGTQGTTTFTMWSTGAGGGAGGTTGGVACAAIAGAFAFKSTSDNIHSSKYPHAFAGSGGGSGAAGWTSGSAAGTVTSAGGGRGGGGLIIECGGAWNFTTASGISVAGKTGTAASQGGTTRASGGGGGGGGGGYLLVLYNTLTANSGTITISGGSGTAGVADYSAGADTGMGGGSGGGGLTASSAGGNGGSSSVGSGSSGTDGLSLVIKNTEFA